MNDNLCRLWLATYCTPISALVKALMANDGFHSADLGCGAHQFVRYFVYGKAEVRAELAQLRAQLSLAHRGTDESRCLQPSCLLCCPTRRYLCEGRRIIFNVLVWGSGY